MNSIIDTNVVVSGLLWDGPPNQLLKWARDEIIRVFTCEETNIELMRGINYKRFAKRLSIIRSTPDKVFAYFMNLLVFIPSPEFMPEKIIEDPFDNLFLALASENKAHLIISRDNHLLDLKKYNHIQILHPPKRAKLLKSKVE